MAGETFRIESDATEELLTSAEAWQAVNDAVQDAADWARRLTPSADEREHIVASRPEVVDGVLTGFVGSKSHIWHILEFGSVKNPPYAPLRQAIENAGMRYDPS